jgi:protocatechuate 3,4-dioxygenase beta subunit
MKNAIVMACALAYAPALMGQTSSVAGQVVNEATGAAVRRAIVVLRLTRGVPAAMGPSMPAMDAGTTAETDDQGRFSIRNLKAGVYSVMAERQGFLVPGQARFSGAGMALAVGENQQVTGVTLRMTPHGVITGKVVDESGEPVPNVNVQVLRWGIANGKRQLTVAPTTSMNAANDLGEYRIAGLPPGSYYVMAGPPRPGATAFHVEPQSGPQSAYTSTFHPAALDVRAAAAVQVKAGAELRGIDIKLAKTKAVTVRGRIVDPASPANQPAGVTLLRRGPGTYMNAVGYAMHMPGGEFRIAGVAAGSYTLMARRSGDRSPVAAGASLPIEVGDRDIDGIVLQVTPAVDVEVMVKSEGTARCAVPYLMLQDENGYSTGPGGRGESNSKFTLPGVVPGTYTVNIPSSGPCYVRSLRFGGREAPDWRVTVGASGALEIEMAVSEAVVDGTVTDAAGKPVAQAMVSFVPKDGGPAGRARISAAGRTGSFSAYSIAPGAYDVYAFESVDYEAAQSAEYLKQFAGRARSVTVGTSGRQTIALTAVSAAETGVPIATPLLAPAKGSLEGRAVHAVTGAPLAGVRVTLALRQLGRTITGATAVPGQGPEAAATAVTDEQGTFAMRDVEPDLYYITAERPGFMAAGPADRPFVSGEAIVIGHGQRIEGHTIQLAPQSVIAGKVTDEFGEAVTNAQATLYRREVVGGMRRLSRMGAAQTDDLGRFRIAGIPPGSYYLAVSKRTLGRVVRVAPAPASGPETGYGMVWYPNAADVSGAEAIAVGTAAEVPADVVMRRVKVWRVRGSVTDEEGRPMERPLVGLSPRGMTGGTLIGGALTMPGGVLEVGNVPAGSYLLWARPNENGPSQRQAFAAVEVRDGDAGPIRLQLSTGREVRGVLRTEDGAPPYAMVTMAAAEGYSASSPASGAFVIRGVWPLTYAVEAAGLCPTCYVKSLRFGGHDVPDAGTRFEGEGELEVVVSAAGGTVEGVAIGRDGRPAAGASVAAAVEGSARILRSVTDREGSFSFGGLRPGSYRVYAFEGAAPEELRAGGAAVKVGAGGREKVRVMVGR